MKYAIRQRYGCNKDHHEEHRTFVVIQIRMDENAQSQQRRTDDDGTDVFLFQGIGLPLHEGISCRFFIILNNSGFRQEIVVEDEDC